MIYFVAGRKDHARRAAHELRIHPTGWKYLTRAEDAYGLARVVVIILLDTLWRAGQPLAERALQSEIVRVVESRNDKTDHAVQVVSLSLDQLIGVVR